MKFEDYLTGKGEIPYKLKYDKFDLEIFVLKGTYYLRVEEHPTSRTRIYTFEDPKILNEALNCL